MENKAKSAFTDEELMQAYRAGDQLAFGELYQRYSAKVYGYLKSRLRNDAAVDDVFQVTFMKLHKARAHYDPTFPFVPWLFTVCRSTMIDSVRKTKRLREDYDDEAILKIAAPEARPEAAQAVPDLGRLPATQRKAVELRYGQELSFEEIASRLETSPGNVRQLVSRAVRKLRGAK